MGIRAMSGAAVSGGGGGGAGVWGSITGNINSQSDLQTEFATKENKTNTPYDNGNSGSSITIDFSNGAIQKLTLTADAAITVTGLTIGRVGILFLHQNGGGGHQATWDAATKWADTQGVPTSSSSNKYAVLQFVSEDGTYNTGSWNGWYVGSSAGGSSPLSIADCILWLDGTDTTVMNNGGTIVNGTDIQNWTDKSPQLHSALQNTLAVRPIYKTSELNGFGTLNFLAPGQRFMSLGTTQFTPVSGGSAGPWSVYAIVKQSATSAFTNTFFASMAGLSHGLTFNIEGGGNFVSILGDGGINLKWTPASPFGTSNYHTILIIYNGSGPTSGANYTVIVDGVTLTAASTGAGTGGTNSVVGSYDLVFDNFGLHGLLATLCVWSHALDSTDRATIAAYATNTFGL